MEIRVYSCLENFSRDKRLFCSRVECPDAFSYSSALEVFKSIYGKCVVVFICV